MAIDPKKLRKLKKIADILDKGDVAFVEHLFELEEKIEEEREKIEKKLPSLENIIEKVRGEKGDKGDRGERGDDGKSTKGDRGDRGPEGPRGLKGEDSKIPGPKGEKGDPGRDGRDGVDGKDGEDGFVDEATVAYLEAEIKRLEEMGRRRETNFGHVIREVYAGSGIEITYNGDTNRPTITATGGPGSGITRSIILTSGNVTMGATASTDYVYIVTGAHTITLPTAVGNTNLYTVRNNHSSPITVDTTSSQDIIGAVTATSYSVYNGDARGFVSTGTAWVIV